MLNLESDARRYAITQNGVYLGPLVNASKSFQKVSKQLVDALKGRLDARAPRATASGRCSALCGHLGLARDRDRRAQSEEGEGARARQRRPAPAGQAAVRVRRFRQYRAGPFGRFTRTRRPHRELCLWARRRRARRVAAPDRALHGLRVAPRGRAGAPCCGCSATARVRTARGTSRGDRRRRDRRPRPQLQHDGRVDREPSARARDAEHRPRAPRERVALGARLDDRRHRPHRPRGQRRDREPADAADCGRPADGKATRM